jgi:cytidine deaminase
MELLLFTEIKKFHQVLIIRVLRDMISSVFYVPNRFSVHAERNAIMSVRNKSILKYCKIIIFRLDKSGNILPAEPCEMCSKLLQKYKITRIETIN